MMMAREEGGKRKRKLPYDPNNQGFAQSLTGLRVMVPVI